MSLQTTASQTVGPYFAYGLSPEQYGYQQNLTSIAGSQMAEGDIEGQRIRVEGRVDAIELVEQLALQEIKNHPQGLPTIPATFRATGHRR